jgi:hypothetical protein
MNNDLLNILSNLQHADNQKLTDYLEGKLSGDEKHEVEKMLLEEDFAGDAIEGLQNSVNKEKLGQVVAELNRQLQTQLQDRRKSRRKRNGSIQQWVVVAVILVLVLAVLGYYIIHLLMNP